MPSLLISKANQLSQRKSALPQRKLTKTPETWIGDPHRGNPERNVYSTGCVWNDLMKTKALSASHSATYYNTLQHTAAHCSTLQYTATHFNNCWDPRHWEGPRSLPAVQHTAAYCSTLQHIATPVEIQEIKKGQGFLPEVRFVHCIQLKITAIYLPFSVV